MILGAALLGGGFLGGFFAGRHLRRAREAPVCPCGHELSFHDPETRACHGRTLQMNMRNEYGLWLGDQWVTCTCRQYDGPQRIEQYLATLTLPPKNPE